MRKNLLTQILLSFLALALLASAEHRVHEGDSARCNSEDNKNQN